MLIGDESINEKFFEGWNYDDLRFGHVIKVHLFTYKKCSLFYRADYSPRCDHSGVVDGVTMTLIKDEIYVSESSEKEAEKSIYDFLVEIAEIMTINDKAHFEALRENAYRCNINNFIPSQLLNEEDYEEEEDDE